MPYVVNPLDPDQPTNDKGATQGAEELRKVKGVFINRTLISLLDPDFAVTGDGTADDSTGVQACMDFINALANKGAMFIPGNKRYRLNTTIEHKYGVSMIGEGAFSSRFEPHGCDAFAFNYVAGEGNTALEKFGIFGQGDCSLNYAFIQPGDDNSDHTIFGLTFRDLAVRNMHIGMQFRNVWNTLIENCWWADVDQGFNFIGQIFSMRMMNNTNHKGVGAGGAGPYYGMYLNFHNFTTSGGIRRPEGVHIYSLYQLGYDEPFHLEDAISVSLHEPDFTGSVRAIYFSTAAEFFEVSGGYVVGAGAAGEVIFGQDQSVPIDSKATFKNMRIRGTSLSGTCHGIRLGTGGLAGNVDHATIEDCNFQFLTGYDIAVILSGHFNIINNACLSSGGLSSIALSSIPVNRPGNVSHNHCYKDINFFESEYSAGKFVIGPNTVNDTTSIGYKYRAIDAAYNFASIASGSSASRDVTVTGAALGDLVSVSFSDSIQSLIPVATVIATDTVRVTLGNLTGGAVDLGAMDIFVEVVGRIPTGN